MTGMSYDESEKLIIIYSGVHRPSRFSRSTSSASSARRSESSSQSASGITNPSGGDEVRGGGAGGTSPMKVRQSPKKCAHCGILHPMDLIR